MISKFVYCNSVAIELQFVSAIVFVAHSLRCFHLQPYYKYFVTVASFVLYCYPSWCTEYLLVLYGWFVPVTCAFCSQAEVVLC